MTVLFSNDLESFAHLATLSDFTTLVGATFIVLDEVSFPAMPAPQGVKSYSTNGSNDRNVYNGMSAIGTQGIRHSSYFLTTTSVGHFVRQQVGQSDQGYLVYQEYNGSALRATISVRNNEQVATSSSGYTVSASAGDTVWMETIADGSTIECRLWTGAESSRPSTATLSYSNSLWSTGRVGFWKVFGDGTYANADQILIADSVSDFSGPTINTDQGSYALTGQAANLLTARRIVAEAGTYALTGQEATLTKTTPGAFVIIAESGTYVWTGTDAFADYAMNAEGGSYALIGQEVTFRITQPQNYSIVAERGQYSMTGRTVRLVWSGAPEVPGRSAGIYMGMRIGL